MTWWKKSRSSRRRVRSTRSAAIERLEARCVLSATPLHLHALASTGTGFAGPLGAEISAFDKATERLFVTTNETIDVLDLSDPSSPVAVANIDLASFGANVNSIAAYNGLIAAAVQAADKTDQGVVVFIDAATATVLGSIGAGALPDMVTFTPDGTKVLVANEGEPNSYGQVDSVDPDGSVTIIDVAGGVGAATATHVTFTGFNGQEAALRAQGIRIYGPGASASQDFEPEYTAVSDDSTTAWVTLQENNAIAIVDIATGTVTSLAPLGLKDYSADLPGGVTNGLDPSDRDNGSGGPSIKIGHWPVFGMYEPDAIDTFTVGGETYLVTANEGDARDYTGFAEEIRVGAGGYVLDPTVFPNAATLKNNANLGRLTVSRATGNTDGDGDFDQIHTLGGRSFSIWDSEGNLVFDSGDALEQITAARSPALFNANDGVDFDTRSDNKGPEPEAVAVGVVGGRTYAFVGTERGPSAILVFDVTDPTAPTFVDYVTNPGDISLEGLAFVSAADSPNGIALLIASHEVSHTVTIYQVSEEDVTFVAPEGNGADDLTLRRNGDDVELFDNVAGAVLFSQPLAFTQSVTVVGADGEVDKLTVDYAFGGAFALAGGVDYDGGAGGGDVLGVLGTADGETIAAQAGLVDFAGLAIAFSGVEHLRLDAGAGDNVFDIEGEPVDGIIQLLAGAGDDEYRLAAIGSDLRLTDTGGTDLLNFEDAVAGVAIDLARASGQLQFIGGGFNFLRLTGTLENVVGSQHSDLIRGNAADNHISALGGHDLVFGEDGNDWLDGGDGFDILFGGDGNDTLWGGLGGDLLFGQDGDDDLFGGAGFDILVGGKGNDSEVQ